MYNKTLISMPLKKNGSLKAIDFFCGGGGMTCGLRQAGIDVIAGIDFDKECEETYESNNKGSVFVHSDITTLNVDFLEKRFNIKKNDDELIFVGCSPCQYYSIINTSKEKAKKSKDLLLDFKRFIDYYRPGFVLVENVPGIMTQEDSALPEFPKYLNENGYVYDKKVVNMCYYGVPQNRRRFSLIATRLFSTITLPLPDKECKSVRDCIGVHNGFPRIEAGHIDQSDFFHSVAGIKDLNRERLSLTPHDGGTRAAWKDNSKLQLKCYVGRDNSFKDGYGRLFWDRPSSTITTKFFNISNGRFAHPEEDRAISIREGATLQSFPINYVFRIKTIAGAAKLIGNAVPPEYARRLGIHIVDLIGK